MEGAVRGRRSPEAALLIAEILELAERLRMQLDAPCEGRGVSASRFAVMAAIQQAGAEGCSQTELAGRLNLSESNVSVLIEALRKAGLLYRLRSKVDRRRSVLLLSEEGQELVTLLSAARDVVAESLMAEIAAPQIANLRSLLANLNLRLTSSERDDHRSSSPISGSPQLRRAS